MALAGKTSPKEGNVPIASHELPPSLLLHNPLSKVPQYILSGSYGSTAKATGFAPTNCDWTLHVESFFLQLQALYQTLI
ncbi:TPA: hypothetical protein QCR72_001647 [Bacillus anthracis]|nr:hypothetical protein [Bacillus anthracis]HDR3527785.1 hypothetical protein [Bacillus anthracis]HDR3531475.1 hypothetical protein [Bacillus anthracis]HDR3537252.1 hypothetical protein [Bacillus anthracis]HDR3546081.1 hypothetical protein [Bacillus anthracis]